MEKSFEEQLTRSYPTFASVLMGRASNSFDRRRGAPASLSYEVARQLAINARRMCCNLVNPAKRLALPNRTAQSAPPKDGPPMFIITIQAMRYWAR
jgi:hypothetical protein